MAESRDRELNGSLFIGGGALIAAQLKYNNLTAWHEAGYTGKGVSVMNLETPGGDGHCEACTKRIKDAAPDCTVYETGLTMTATNGVITGMCKYNGVTYSVEDFIREKGIRILTRSVHGSPISEARSKYWNALKAKYNLIIFTIAGNKGETDIGGSFPEDVAMYIGAVGMSDSGTVSREFYSSVGDELDFMNFTGELNGTSFAAPYTAGMAAVILQKYDMTHDQMYAYFKSHCKDLQSEGFDNYTGWGIPTLGNPTTKIVMQIGNKNMTVNDIDIALDQPPVIDMITGRTLIPVRAVVEALGAKVEWQPSTKTIVING